MRKFIVASLAVLMICIILATGCSLQTANKDDYYDDPDKIFRNSPKSRYYMVTYATDGVLEILSFETYNGVDEIYSIDSEGAGKLIMDYSSTCKKGKFKGVLVNPDNEIQTIFENDSSGHIEIDLKKGRSWIKLVGYNAGGKFETVVTAEGDALIHCLMD